MRKTTRNQISLIQVDRNRKLEIFRAPTKAKSREPAYSQALNQNKIDRQRSSSRESGRQAGRQSDGYGGWCLELRRGGRHGEDDESFQGLSIWAGLSIMILESLNGCAIVTDCRPFRTGVDHVGLRYDLDLHLHVSVFMSPKRFVSVSGTVGLDSWAETWRRVWGTEKISRTILTVKIFLMTFFSYRPYFVCFLPVSTV